jgi:hypothetical protein
MNDVVATIDLYGPLWLISTVWIVVAGTVALLAARRGYNPFLWFVVGLVASPAVTLVLLALITPRRGGQPPAP